ncbi:hypothetical protein A2U01_0063494, partial [Trifolium medium]|nr:hypothetical protein [Trifolium medium]
GSSCDIMYAHLFQTLQLDETHLTPYVGSDLQGFNGATTKPWGYVDLIDQGQVPVRRLPVPLSMHHRQNGYRIPDRRSLYCPYEDEVLHA